MRILQRLNGGNRIFSMHIQCGLFILLVCMYVTGVAQTQDGLPISASHNIDSIVKLYSDSAFSFFRIHGDFSKRTLKRYTSIISNTKDTSSFGLRIGILSDALESDGYIGWKADYQAKQGDTLHIHIENGPEYHVQNFEIQDLPAPVWQISGGQKLYRKNSLYNRFSTEFVFSQILGYYQDRGYPFSRLVQDSIGFHHTRDSSRVDLNIRYRFDAGNLYRIDSFLITSKIRESDRFVKNVVRIHEGDMYNHSDIQSIPGLLNNTIYYQQVPAPELTFSEDGKVVIRVKPEVRKASRFDGIIGVLPPVDTSASLQLTGLLDFQLVSPFGAGEILALRFEQLPIGSQRLGVKYIQPWILGTPIKTETELNIFKQDTTFLTRYFKLTPYYQLNRFLALKVWYRSRSSALLSTALYRNSKTLPPVLDSRDQALGFGFEYDKLDYRLNPTKGFVLRTDFGAGNKVIRRNAGLDSLDYDKIVLNLPSREISFYFRYFISPVKRSVIMLGNQTFRLDLSQYFRNDLQTIGGSQLLRGFNENQFFARFYSLFTLEYRYLLDRNSNLFVFVDHAYIDWREADTRQELRPTGIGGGLNFETRAGILNITFATGSVGDIPFTPSRPRVHFGIVSLF